MAACAFEPVPSKLVEAGVKGLAEVMMSQVKVILCIPALSLLTQGECSSAIG